jgi:hypothetical protein
MSLRLDDFEGCGGVAQIEARRELSGAVALGLGTSSMRLGIGDEVAEDACS